MTTTTEESKGGGGTLRQRRKPTTATTSETSNRESDAVLPRVSENGAVLPWVSENGELITEKKTPIPSTRKQQQQQQQQQARQFDFDINSTGDDDNGREFHSHRQKELIATPDPSSSESSSINGSNRFLVSGEAVKKDENRIKKIIVRLMSGLGMIVVFVGCIFAGHLYVCGLVAFVEVLLFRELVRVRYNAYFHTIQDNIPLFRTTQWLWFAVAILYAYGDFVHEIITSNQDLHYLLGFGQYWTVVSFLFYSGTFVLTIATMQVGHIKFQLNQLSWTIVVLCLTVGQLKYIMHNIYNGLYWFTLPITLVVINDIMAYVAGMTCGRKFIRHAFIRFSPNKTWEGFIGGAIFTLISSWYLSWFLAQFKWMTCPTNEFSLHPTDLDCELDPIFQDAQNIFPPQLFELLPSVLVKFIPGIVDKCSVMGSNDVITACISGEATHTHHHFELIVKNVYPVQIHTLALATFASFVAPFGGFLASAIKRAYGIKDFDSIIPGHGGVMDRFDCQLLMALCVWVYYNTFIKMATVSVSKMVYMYNLLSDQEKAEFVETIKSQNHKSSGG